MSADERGPVIVDSALLDAAEDYYLTSCVDPYSVGACGVCDGCKDSAPIYAVVESARPLPPRADVETAVTRLISSATEDENRRLFIEWASRDTRPTLPALAAARAALLALIYGDDTTKETARA